MDGVEFGGRVLVDVNTNFEFVTNFGRYPIADIMQSYVFESIFPTLEQFFSLRLQMKNHKENFMVLTSKLDAIKPKIEYTAKRKN